MSQSTADLYRQLHARSLTDPEGFWGEAAEDITWFKRWDKVLDDSNPPFYRWFKGGVLNTCYNTIDRHVEAGHGAQPAIIYDSPVTQTVQTITYEELRGQVAQFAGALRRLGVEKGDRVIIYMPMIPQAPVAMYACATGGRALGGVRRLRPARARRPDQRRPTARRRLRLLRHRTEPDRQV